MTFAQLIPLAIQISIVLLVFALALKARLGDVTQLLRQPAQLLRSLIAMNVIMPIIAVAIAMIFTLRPAVELALVALALSPVPPFLPQKQVKLGGRASYAAGLFVAVAAISIVLIPVALLLIGYVFKRPVEVPLASVLKVVLLTVILPVAAGVAFRQFQPDIAERVAKPLSLIAMLLLALCVIPVLISQWDEIVSLIGNGTLVAFAAFAAIGLGVGHVMGGANSDDRTVLALATASRHPGVALAIAGANNAEQQPVLAAILLYVVVSAVATIPYGVWRKRSQLEASEGTE